MRPGKDGRSYIEFKDIDLVAGFRALRWFWVFYLIIVLMWIFSQ
jgi:hypothetical protein